MGKRWPDRLSDPAPYAAAVVWLGAFVVALAGIAVGQSGSIMLVFDPAVACVTAGAAATTTTAGVARLLWPPRP